MAKLSITRLLETSRILATDAGKQLSDLIIYLSDFAEQTLRALRNGLTYRDNFNCLVTQVELEHEKPQIINSGGRNPEQIHHKTISKTTALQCLIWFTNDQGQLVVLPTFKAAPTGKVAVVLTLVFQ